MEHLKPLSSTLAGARTESLGKLKEEQLKVGPKGAQHRERWKSTSVRRSARMARREGTSESNSAKFHEWGVAPLENSIVGMISVPSGNSWFRYSGLGCLTRWTGSVESEAMEVGGHVHLRQKGQVLDFLQFSFRYDRSLYDQGNRYWNMYPSKKSIAREREKRRGRFMIRVFCQFIFSPSHPSIVSFTNLCRAGHT